MATKKKTTKAVGTNTSKAKPVKKTNKKSPGVGTDPEFDNLLHILLLNTGKGNLKLNPEIYTKDVLIDWLTRERSQRIINYDSNPDLEHLKRLDIWDHRQLFEVIFGVPWECFAEIERRGDDCQPTDFYERVKLVQSHRLPEILEYKPAYEWIEEIKNWQITTNKARGKFEEILNRSWRTIPGVGWKEGEWYFIVESFIPWLKEELKILDWLKREGCLIPDWLENFLSKWKTGDVKAETNKKISPTKGSSKGRPEFPYSEQFERAVKDQKSKGTAINDIPFTAPVTRIFAKNVLNEGKVIDDKEYKEAYGWSLRKVRENVKKALSE